MMDTGFVQVFVMLLSQCVAPEGKTVCQEEQLMLDFLNKADCELALQQILDHKDQAENVIVNHDKSSCLPTARKMTVYRSMDHAQSALSGQAGWGQIPVASESLDFTQEAHQERLASVPECSEVGGTAPCRIGEIIIEGATVKKTDVWRRANP